VVTATLSSGLFLAAKRPGVASGLQQTRKSMLQAVAHLVRMTEVADQSMKACDRLHAFRRYSQLGLSP
jgi:hypothetical protein